MNKKWAIEIYQGRRKEWRWKLTGKNGEKVGASSEGFERRAGAIKNFTLVTGISIRVQGRVRGGMEWHPLRLEYVRSVGLFV